MFDSGYNWVVSVPVAWLLCHRTALPVIVVYLIIQALDMIKTTIGRIMIGKKVWMDRLVEGE